MHLDFLDFETSRKVEQLKGKWWHRLLLEEVTRKLPAVTFELTLCACWTRGMRSSQCHNSKQFVDRGIWNLENIFWIFLYFLRSFGMQNLTVFPVLWTTFVGFKSTGYFYTSHSDGQSTQTPDQTKTNKHEYTLFYLKSQRNYQWDFIRTEHVCFKRLIGLNSLPRSCSGDRLKGSQAHSP